MTDITDKSYYRCECGFGSMAVIVDPIAMDFEGFECESCGATILWESDETIEYQPNNQE